jgi:hypothetical protein
MVAVRRCELDDPAELVEHQHYAWTPTVANSAFRVAVWVRNAGSTADTYDNPQSNGSIAFAVNPATPPLLVTGLSANRVSPQQVGTPITFTAAVSGGTAPQQFKWMFVRRQQHQRRAGLVVEQCLTWTPTTANAAYQVTVWARNAASSTDCRGERELDPEPSIRDQRGAADSADPDQSDGESARTAGSWYAGHVHRLGLRWHRATPIQVVGVRRPNVDSTAELVLEQHLDLDADVGWRQHARRGVGPQCGQHGRCLRQPGGERQHRVRDHGWWPDAGSVGSHEPDRKSRVTAAGGTPITFTAAVSGGTAPQQFKWMLFDGSNTSVVQGWSTTNTWTWTPTTANAAYQVTVWARSAASSTDAAENANSTRVPAIRDQRVVVAGLH